jgi:hypothetical protein
MSCQNFRVLFDCAHCLTISSWGCIYASFAGICWYYWPNSTRRFITWSRRRWCDVRFPKSSYWFRRSLDANFLGTEKCQLYKTESLIIDCSTSTVTIVVTTLWLLEYRELCRVMNKYLDWNGCLRYTYYSMHVFFWVGWLVWSFCCISITHPPLFSRRCMSSFFLNMEMKFYHQVWICQNVFSPSITKCLSTGWPCC